MASKFSSYAISPDCTDGHQDPPTDRPCVSSSHYFLLNIPIPYSTIQLIHLFIATTANHCSNYLSHPFMKPRCMAPMHS